MQHIVSNHSQAIAQPMAFRSNGETGIVNTSSQQNKRGVTKVVQLNQNQSAMLSYSPHEILSDQRTYVLHAPLFSKFSQEEDYFIIENEALGIVATGTTDTEAKQVFAQEFDFIYQRYNQLSDEQLTARIKGIKAMLNTIVKDVTSK